MRIMNGLNDMLISNALNRIALEIGLTKMSIDALTRQIEFQRNLEDLRRPSEFSKRAEESDALIRENFKEWRDYLHKYILIMTTITGFFTVLISAKWTRVVPDLGMVYTAFGLIGTSIVVGIIAIFATIFIEKRIVDARVMFSLPAVKKRDPRINLIECHRMDCREAIAENQAKLDQETNEDEIAWLKVRIKADKYHMKLMKYVAAPSEWIEYVRVGTTALMMCLSFAGIAILMHELLAHSVEIPAAAVLQEAR